MKQGLHFLTPGGIIEASEGFDAMRLLRGHDDDE